MSVTQSNKSLFNGDHVIKFTDRKTVQSIQGYQDLASMGAWYQEDPNKHHLGLMSLWGQQARTTYPMYRELLADKAVMEVNGVDGSFTYDIAIKETANCTTIRDTSNQDFPGLDESTFKIVLTKQFAPGDIISADPLFGEQLVVSQDEEVVMRNEGFEHSVKLVSTSKRAYYDSALLVKGIQYYKVAHTMFGEYAQNYSNVDFMDSPTTMTCKFQLGNMSGVEAMVTGNADRKTMGGATAHARAYVDDLMNEAMDLGEFAVIADRDGVTGKAKPSTMRIGATMEFLVHREHEKLVAQALLFQKAGVIREANGVARLNEGLWHQIRRGKLIKYGRPGGITRAHIKEAVEYVFRANDKPAEERVVKFKGGKEAVDNIYQIFKEEVGAQVASLAPFMGSERILPTNPVSGSLLNLKLAPVRFTEVYIPGIGNLQIEEDPSLNNIPMTDRFQKGMHANNRAHTVYSLVIWDVADAYYSNNKVMPKGATVIEGGNTKANIYLVKPEGEMTYWGSDNGRYNNKKASDVVSSYKTMAQSFWIHSSVALHVRDLTRFVVIELDEAARKGFN
jgi:hypothetical protein